MVMTGEMIQRMLLERMADEPIPMKLGTQPCETDTAPPLDEHTGAHNGLGASDEVEQRPIRDVLNLMEPPANKNPRTKPKIKKPNEKMINTFVLLKCDVKINYDILFQSYPYDTHNTIL